MAAYDPILTIGSYINFNYSKAIAPNGLIGSKVKYSTHHNQQPSQI